MSTQEQLEQLLNRIPEYLVPEEEWRQLLGQAHHEDEQRLIALERSGMRLLTGLVVVLIGLLSLAILYRPPFMGAWIGVMLVLAGGGGLWLVGTHRKGKEYLALQSMMDREQLLLLNNWTMPLPVWEHLEDLVNAWPEAHTWQEKIQELEEYGWSKPPLGGAFWEQLKGMLDIMPTIEDLDALDELDQELEGVDDPSEGSAESEPTENDDGRKEA